MEISGEYEGTKRYVQARWPLFALGYGGGALLSVAAAAAGIIQGWPALIPLAAALIMVIAYLAGTALWSAHRLYDNNNIRDRLFELGQFRPDDSFVYLDVGVRWLPANMARRLTTGQIIVIDIYNPILTPDGSLARSRRQTLHPRPDPRLSWRDGDISLLPLPDGSVPAVVLSEVASEFWQQGDRDMLIGEIYRILASGGRLILAERVRTTTNLLTMGLNGFELETADYWRDLLTQTGFRIKREESLEELIHFIRADKPLAYEGKQLVFDF
jgi:ubiquinone/menaquinone biosynthesis C-methylase UbiE